MLWTIASISIIGIITTIIIIDAVKAGSAKPLIRWLFLVLLLGFLYIARHFNMLFRDQELFLILLFVISGATVLGVVFFRDSVMEAHESEKGPELASTSIKKLMEEEDTKK